MHGQGDRWGRGAGRILRRQMRNAFHGAARRGTDPAGGGIRSPFATSSAWKRGGALALLGMGFAATGSSVLSEVPFFADAAAGVHPRFYYLNRHFDTPHTQETMALGGGVELKTGEWMGLSFGAVPYTSQRLAGEDPHDGASLLKAGQEGYSVLGQAHARWRGWDSEITLHRQILDTPMLNSYDVKMTPVTFEACTYVNRSVSNLTITLSQVDAIKGWTETSFRSPSEAAGFDDTDEGITLAGVQWSTEPLTAQVWEYHARHIVNSVYAQVDLHAPDEGLPVGSLSVQGLHQRDAGEAYAGEFQTGMGGVLGGLSWKGFTLNLGGTVTDKGGDIYNPWAAYPGYTSLVEEDCNLAGEQAWMAGLAYDFSGMGLEGWNAFHTHSEAWTPERGTFSDPAQYEDDLTVDFKPGGAWQGLAVRWRAAFIRNSLSTEGADYEDLRCIVNYEKVW